MTVFEIVLLIEVGIIAVVNLLGAIPPPTMIIIGIILLIVGVFVARQYLWPLGGILILVGVLLFVLTPGYAYY